MAALILHKQIEQMLQYMKDNKFGRPVLIEGLAKSKFDPSTNSLMNVNSNLTSTRVREA